MKTGNKILLIDDDKNYLNFLNRSLSVFASSNDLEVLTFQDSILALDEIEKNHHLISVIVTDFLMPSMDGLELIKKIEKDDRNYQIILLTGQLDRRITESFLHMNIFDLLEKTSTIQKINESVKQAFTFYKNKINKLSRIEAYLKKFPKSVNEENSEQDALDLIIGQSEAIINLKKDIQKIANSDATCLMMGESGTGKELIANAICKCSENRNKKLTIVNCASIPKESFESELLGYKKGFILSKNSDKVGLLELADGGTVFFNEITELSIEMQSKLFRFLLESEIQVLGDSNSKKLDVRVIAATNKNLQSLVKEGLFREDLYYKLNVIPFHIPALRNRKSDIKLLLEFFMKMFSELENKKITGYTDEFLSTLESYYWPGNVREFRNIIQRIILFKENETLSIKDIPQEIVNYNASENINIETNESKESYFMKDIEKNSIIQALKKTNNNKEKAAKLLGISRASIYRKMKEYSIE